MIFKYFAPFTERIAERYETEQEVSRDFLSLKEPRHYWKPHVKIQDDFLKHSILQ